MSVWLWKHWFGPWVLQVLGAQPLDSGDASIAARLRLRAREMRLSVPNLYRIPDFSPNAIFLISSQNCADFVLSDGLIQALNADELDAVLCHGLSQLKSWDSRRALWLAILFYPIARLLQFLPPILSILLSFWPRMGIRFFLSPKRFSRADASVAAFQRDARFLAASLQKASALARKIPMRQRNWVWHPLFWISPIEQEFPLIVQTHPKVTRRLADLLGQPALDLDK